MSLARLRPYGAAAAILAAGFAARLALQPVFGPHHTFTVFYPGVILAAYFLGAWPAALTALISAGLAYWVFAQQGDEGNLVTLGFFGFTSAVSIYFITGMRKALTELAEARARAEALAASHSELFRNLNERVTNHLQLVAALLQLQARDERDEKVGRALSEAAARTLLISRAHRSLSGDLEPALDFDAFARQLVVAAFAGLSKPGLQVVIEPMGVQLALDHATSVAVVLLECIQARLEADQPATLHVGLRRSAHQVLMTVSETSPLLGSIVAADRRPYLIEAMVEQLGGRFSSRREAAGIVSELVFPAQPERSADCGLLPSRALLH